MLSIIQRDQWSVRGALSAAAKILVTRVELRIIQQPRRSELNQSSFLGAPRVGDLDARKPMRGLESHFDGPGPVAF
jgi:hypothetical protein